MRIFSVLNTLLLGLVGLAVAAPITNSGFPTEDTTVSRIYSVEDVDIKAIGDTY
ncbi:hypothetical protein BDV12DRAFT_181166 [Aspergillus spectabilis]